MDVDGIVLNQKIKTNRKCKGLNYGVSDALPKRLSIILKRERETAWLVTLLITKETYEFPFLTELIQLRMFYEFRRSHVLIS